MVAPSQSALELLAAKIEQATGLGLLPQEWRDLARQAVVEASKDWESERVFRRRTGVSDRWCRRNFDRYQKAGQARWNNKLKGKCRREWKRTARLSKPGVRDENALVSQIVGSYEEPQ